MQKSYQELFCDINNIVYTYSTKYDLQICVPVCFFSRISSWCAVGAYFTLEGDEDAMQMRLVATSARAASSRALSLDPAERGASAGAPPARSHGRRPPPKRIELAGAPRSP